MDDEEAAGGKRSQTQQEYEEACQREEEEILRLIALGTPATPKMFPMSKKRSRSKSATRKIPSTPTTLGSIKESPSDVLDISDGTGSVGSTGGANDDGAMHGEEKGGEQGFEIALQDRMEFKKSQIPVKNLIQDFTSSQDFTQAEKNTAAALAAATGGTLVGLAQSVDRQRSSTTEVESRSSTKDDEEGKRSSTKENTVGSGDVVKQEEPRPISPNPSAGRQLRPISPSPSVGRQHRPISPTQSDMMSIMSTDDSLYLEGNSTVASTSVAGDKSAGGKAKESGRAQLSSSSLLDRERSTGDSTVGEPGQIIPAAYSTKQEEKSQERTIGTSGNINKSPGYSGVSVRPRRQSSEYSRNRESMMDSRRTRPQAEDLSSDRAAVPRAEYMPSTGNSFVKDQIQRFSNDGNSDSTSPREGNRKSVQQGTGLDAPSDAWSGFMNELAKAEEQFFNPNAGTRTSSDRSKHSSSSPPK
jgi:hypothetical protein